MKNYLKMYMPEELTYEEAEELGNFVEDALSLTDVIESLEEEDIKLLLEIEEIGSQNA